jgi:predicted RNA binding protein YcfA (HicA-like mRNA interferase family)
MRKESSMTVREVVRQLTDDGWIEVAQRGSHRQFKHPTKLGKVTVAGKLGDDVRIGTYKSILRQAGLERK